MLIMAAQLILGLSILVVLHELGHFVPAKIFKTKVEKFYLFFDPGFSLFKITRGETEYGIGWLPLGGYVKIAGMIDESMDKEQMKLPPEPWEFRAKPAWQRLIIMIGGVTVNVILGMFLYAMVLFVWGESVLPPENVKYGVAVDTLGYQMGLRDGDMIEGVDNKPLESIEKMSYAIVINQAKSIQVNRNGETLDIAVTEDDISDMISQKYSLVQPRFPFEVDSVLPNRSAAAAGVLKGDRVIAVNSYETPYFQDAVKILQANKNLEVALSVLRNTDTVNLTATISGAGKIGVAPKGPGHYFDLSTKEYSLTQAIPAGINKAYVTFEDYIKQFSVMFTVKDAHKEVGGFGALAKAYGSNWNWQRFWTFTAFLSIVLAIMNILPIPALDGGHVMFLLYEIISGRKPNEKVMEYAQYAGMFLLLSLLLYANGNDVIRGFFSK